MPYTVPEDNLHFAAIHSNPPGISTDVPAIVTRRVGKGSVTWCAGALETDERKVFGDMFLALINRMTGGDYAVSATASENVENITFKTEKAFYISAISLSADPICEYPVKISVKTGKTPVKIKKVPEETELSFSFGTGRTEFCDRVNLHSSYVIEL